MKNNRKRAHREKFDDPIGALAFDKIRGDKDNGKK